jgi:nucleoside-diphosphate-sugar epimerase
MNSNKRNNLEILIGGGGFIGTNYQNIFPDKKLIIIDKNFKHKFNNENFNYIKSDILISDKKSHILNIINDLILKNNYSNITIHAYAATLGIKTVIESEFYIQNEIKIQMNQFKIILAILDLLKNNFKKYQLNIIYYSSSEVYGDASFMQENSYLKIKGGEDFYKRRRYASSKLLTEDLYLEFYNQNKDYINLLIVRPFNVVGKWQNEEFVIPKMILDGKLKKKIEVYDGNQERIFIHVDDFNNYINELNQKIIELNLKDLIIFNIANLRNNIKIINLAQLIQKILYDKYGFEVEIDIQESNKLIIGAKQRLPDVSRLTENIDYRAEKRLKDILLELIDWY